MKTWLRRSIWIVLAGLLVLLVARSFRPAPVLVDTATVSRGPLVVTVDDDGRTRVRERYTISAPVGGRLLRTALRPGDEVEAADTLVAEFVAPPPSVLDARTRSELVARVRRAEAALRAAEARADQARSDDRFARQELERIRPLAEEGIQSAERLDRAVRDAQRAQDGLRAETFALQVAGYELELARASLLEIAPPDPDAALDDGAPLAEVSPPDPLAGDPADGASRSLLLRSPIDGVVLRVFEESARALGAGTPILEVGNTDVLEIVAEYLSQDAVRVLPDMEVLVHGWGGETVDEGDVTLHGRVRLVEPGGFTKVSALGVEEQRVNVVIDPVGDDAEWSALGDGFRVEVRIVLWEAEDALVVPTGALFREGGAWHVFTIEGGAATRRQVTIGRRNGLEAQVLEGIAEGEEVLLYPSELIGDGTPVVVR